MEEINYYFLLLLFFFSIIINSFFFSEIQNITRPKSAEIEVKFIGKCGSPAKLPKTEPASIILQWLVDTCDSLPTIAAKLQQRYLRTKQKEQPDWENSKGQQPQEGTHW